jgi:cell wall assembly regulator SMI1
MHIRGMWELIEEWMGQNSISNEFLLAGPASEEDLKTAEAALGLRLPADVRSSYRMHDGSNRVWISEHGYLMPLLIPALLPRRKQALFNAIVKRWTLLRELLDRGSFDGSGFESRPDGPIRTAHWNVNWIPITYNECGDHLCIDMAPAKGGKRGQIIEWDHEVGAKRVIATSFSRWLKEIADGMQGGKYRFDARTGGLKLAFK